MPSLTKTTLTGILRGPDGVALGGARLRFQLSNTGADIGSNSLLATTPVEVISAADGAVSVALWPNANGFSNSHYVVTAFVSDGSSEVAYEFGKIQVPSVGPADIADLLGAGVLRKRSVEEQVIESALRAQEAAQQAEAQAATYNEAAVEGRLTQRVDDHMAAVTDLVPLSPNLFDNSLMGDVDTSGAAPYPVGYTAVGVAIEVMHPFTQGFEGVYAAAPPGHAVTDPGLATQASPMWYGPHDLGPQLVNGGLRNGWGSLGRGNIMRITASAGTGPRYVQFPQARAARVTGFWFSAWVKLVQGSRLGFGNHSGFYGASGGEIVTADDCAAAPAGWVFVSGVRSGTQPTFAQSGRKLMLGFDATDDVEAYVALPYAWVPANDANHWYME